MLPPPCPRRCGLSARICVVPAYPALRKAFPAALELAALPPLAPALPPCRLLGA